MVERQQSTHRNIDLSSKQLSIKRVNSLWPSDVIWLQRVRSSLVHIMACCLLCTKPLPEPIVIHCQLDPYMNKLQWNSNQNTKIYIEENAFQNVVFKMAAILFQPQSVNTVRYQWKQSRKSHFCLLDFCWKYMIIESSWGTNFYIGHHWYRVDLLCDKSSPGPFHKQLLSTSLKSHLCKSFMLSC